MLSAMSELNKFVDKHSGRNLMRILRLGLVIPTIFILAGCSVGAKLHESAGNFNSISGSEDEQAFGASFINPPKVGMEVRTEQKAGGYTSAQVSFTTVIEVKTTGFKWRNNGKGTESVTWNAGGEAKNK